MSRGVVEIRWQLMHMGRTEREREERRSLLVRVTASSHEFNLPLSLRMEEQGSVYNVR